MKTNSGNVLRAVAFAFALTGLVFGGDGFAALPTGSPESERWRTDAGGHRPYCGAQLPEVQNP